MSTCKKARAEGSKNYHDEFGRWMLMLSRRSPRSVIIKLNSGPMYRIPSCLFSLGDLKSLQLKNCIISLPRVFQGFKSLTYLSLSFFSSTDRDIQNLISFCPELTYLRLTSFEGIKCLNIQSPTLEDLLVDGYFEDINLDAPNLEEAVLSLDLKAKSYQFVPIAHDKESHIKKSLGSLSDIEMLIVGGFFMKYLSMGCIVTKLPVVFTRLEDISLVICFSDKRQVLTACFLFQNAPNLKNLGMLSYPSRTWDQDKASIQELTLQMQMDHLVTASVKEFRGRDYEVDFVAKLLSWAPALEEVKLEWKGQIDRSMVLTKLLALPRVSPRAKSCKPTNELVADKMDTIGCQNDALNIGDHGYPITIKVDSGGNEVLSLRDSIDNVYKECNADYMARATKHLSRVNKNDWVVYGVGHEDDKGHLESAVGAPLKSLRDISNDGV
ncbi:hypothetical protein TRIUR3_01467 [Triticum urartu]|uniref:F-box/LRR-repeat protein 15/At3g58940/PEG3-like LRR domain-containing protein n=1 Tax=Triticum urartu TaxID=4572 RepID=M8A1Q9_TRIUA|nr:hypothetical protein TRIUR3_01467 [Triticum urartu]